VKIKLFIFVFVLGFNSSVKAGDIATESTQWANGGFMLMVQQISAKIQDAQEAIRIIEDAMSMDVQGLIGQMPGAQPIIDLLNQVEGVIAQGRALAHTSAGLEQKMIDRFKSYEDYLADLGSGAATILNQGTTPILNAQGAQVNGMSREAYVERYKEWSATNDKTIRNILKAHGMQAGQFNTEKARFETLQTMSRNSEGRMQALQIGNEIANEQLLQMQKLREIMMEQSSLHASYFAKKRAQEAEDAARATISTQRLNVLSITDGVAVGVKPAGAWQ